MTNDIAATLRDRVKTYCEKYRNPNLPQFAVSKQHDMRSWYGQPEAAQPGCYVFYSQTGDILYIGKASVERHMGSRLAAHDRRMPPAEWRKKAAFVYFVAVSEPFEAPSLEEFLRRELKPQGNKL